MNNSIKALQTNYRGIKYRSRTEARWAVYLDELQIAYAYEPEGFDLGGDWYLPDFWLPAAGLWFEVKGVEPNERERRVAEALSRASRCPVVIAVGSPSLREEYTLRVYVQGQWYDAAFMGWGEYVCISNGGWLDLRVRGGRSDMGGCPEILTGPARVAAAERFGVHD